MAIQKTDLYDFLINQFPDADINIQELADDNDHYAVQIASTQFKNVSRIAQHKMVYNALKGRVGTQIHALSLTTLIKEDYHVGNKPSF